VPLPNGQVHVMKWRVTGRRCGLVLQIHLFQSKETRGAGPVTDEPARRRSLRSSCRHRRVAEGGAYLARPGGMAVGAAWLHYNGSKSEVRSLKSKSQVQVSSLALVLDRVTHFRAS
jgi:hypothetical protein